VAAVTYILRRSASVTISCDDFTTKSDDELLRLILSHVTLTPSLVGSLIKDGKAQGRKQAAAALRAVMEGDDV